MGDDVLKGEVICTTKCYHGRLFEVGDKTTAEALEALGGFVPKRHFASTRSPLARDVSAEGHAEKERLRNTLIAKNINVPADASLEKLRALVEKASKKKKTDNALDGV